LRGNLNVVKALVTNKIDVNAYDQDGNTALHFAAENGYKEIIEFLLDYGSKIRKNR
jgi:ankyrin repeat protein